MLVLKTGKRRSKPVTIDWSRMVKTVWWTGAEPDWPRIVHGHAVDVLRDFKALLASMGVKL